MFRIRTATWSLGIQRRVLRSEFLLKAMKIGSRIFRGAVQNAPVVPVKSTGKWRYRSEVLWWRSGCVYGESEGPGKQGLRGGKSNICIVAHHPCMSRSHLYGVL